uniref:Uncharacterized protein n=1 Tax=Arundo donax TaxID=35708 RepID=A0A0A9EJ41_ARUDO
MNPAIVRHQYNIKDKENERNSYSISVGKVMAFEAKKKPTALHPVFRVQIYSLRVPG